MKMIMMKVAALADFVMVIRKKTNLAIICLTGSKIYTTLQSIVISMVN